MPGQLLVDSRTGLMPSVTVPARGVLVDLAVAAFEAAYSGAYVFSTRLVFLCDFLHATAPCVVLFTSSVAANDAYFIGRFGERGATDATGTGGRTSLKTTPISVDELQVGKREFHSLQATALIKASTLGLINVPVSAAAQLRITVASSRFARSVTHAVDVDSVGLQRVRSALEGTPAPIVATLASTRVRAEASFVEWNPPRGIAMCIPEPAMNASVAEVATADPTEVTSTVAQLVTVTRDKYTATREQLFGRIEPQKFGLGAKRDSLDDVTKAHSRPGPVPVDAVGLIVQWKAHIVVGARNAVQRCFLHKASVGPPGRKGARGEPDVEPPLLRTDLGSLLTSWLGGREVCTDVNSHVERALRTEPAALEWVIPARDATGVLLSQSVSPTLVKLRIWAVTLPDDADWSIAPASSGPTRALEVWLPLIEGLAPRRRVNAEDIRESYSVTPSGTPATPYVVNTLSLATPVRLHDEYAGLHLRHFASFIEERYCASAAMAATVSTGGGLPSQLATVDSDANWPAIQRAVVRHNSYTYAQTGDEESDRIMQRAILREFREQLRLLEVAAMLSALRDTVTITCPGSARYPCIPVYCNGTVFEDIAAGRKTVESRLMWGPYAKVEVGWLLCIKRNTASSALWAIVTAIHRHNSFPEAARFHGEALFPNLELASLTDAQISYSCFCMYHPSASQRTMNTLRKWLMSTTTPGCVVCWTIKTLPEQC